MVACPLTNIYFITKYRNHDGSRRRHNDESWYVFPRKGSNEQDNKRRKFAPKSSSNVKPSEPRQAHAAMNEAGQAEIQTLVQTLGTPMSPPRGRGIVISQPGETQSNFEEQVVDYPDDVSVATMDSTILPPALLALKNAEKGQKNVKIKLPQPGQTWASLDTKKKRKSARGRSLWSYEAINSYLDDGRLDEDGVTIEKITFEDIYARATEAATIQFESMNQMDMLASVAEMAADTEYDGENASGKCFSRIVSASMEAGRAILEANGGRKPEDMEQWDFVKAAMDNVGPIDFTSVNPAEELVNDEMVDPDVVISNLTLSQVIDNFDGTVPTKNQEKREKARIGKAVLSRLYRKKEMLEELGVPLPQHLQDLPPKPEPDPPRENMRTPSRTPSLPPPAQLDLVEERAAPQVRIVDGNVVLDEASLIVEPKMQIRDQGAFPSMDRDHGDKPITSYTYMRRKNHADRWTDEEDLRFYECLSYWGTDLSMVSKCFPARPYKQIKAKLLREERGYPNKVKDAIMKRIKCGLSHFKRMG